VKLPRLWADTTTAVFKKYVKLLFGEWVTFWGWIVKIATAIFGFSLVINPELILGLFIGFLVGVILLAPFYELEKVKKRSYDQQLHIRVLGGRASNLSKEEKEYIPLLVLDVINDEEPEVKLIELEARLVRVFQWHKGHSTRNEEANNPPISGMLLWENERSQIELRPGFPPTGLQIAILRPDDNALEFRTQPRQRNVESLKEEAIYEVLIEFKGKLEGNDSRFKTYFHTGEFFASPESTRLDFTGTATRLDEIPKNLIRFVRYSEATNN